MSSSYEQQQEQANETSRLLPHGILVDNEKEKLAKARRLLYVSHAFAQISETSWQFALILFLAAFTNYQSLILVSTYGMVNGLAVCVFGSAAGNYVDRTSRLVAARRLIWAENSSILFATTCCFLLLKEQTTHHGPTWLSYLLPGVPLDAWSVLLIILVHLFGPLARILDAAFLVAMERDWVVAMSPSSTWLSETNVAMKQIDLSCKVLGPAVGGWVIGAFDDLSSAVWLVGGVNVASLVVEYMCTSQIYALVPALAVQKPPYVHRSSSLVVESFTMDEPPPVKKRRLFRVPQGLKVYLKQPISSAGIGLALLYLNALTFGALMTAYLVWRGMRLETVGLWRGISSAIGLIGTFVYRYSVKRTTIVSTGMWSICYQFACLTLCFASFYVKDFTASVVMLVLGVCASRIGLWVFDISVTQLMQEFVPDGVRGIVGGTQQGLNAFFSLGSFALGMIFPDPRDFPIYAFAGYLAVGIAMVLYAVDVYVKADQFLTESEKLDIV